MIKSEIIEAVTRVQAALKHKDSLRATMIECYKAYDVAQTQYGDASTEHYKAEQNLRRLIEESVDYHEPDPE